MRNRFAVVWIWLFLLPLAFDFDFRNLAFDGKIVQLALIVTSMGAACALLLIAPRFARGSRMRKFVTSLFLLTLAGSAATQWLQDNAPGNYMRVMLPFLLMLLGYFVGCRPWDARRLAGIEAALRWSMIASLAVSIGLGMMTGGTLDDAAARIVPSTFLCLQALLLYEFVFAKYIAKLTVLLFLATIVVELLFVTRSVLVGTVLLFAFATWLAAPSIRRFFSAGVRAVMILSMLGAMAAASAALFPMIVANWIPQMPLIKDDAALTRFAEMKAQYDQTTSTTLSTIVGMGYGHGYRYTPSSTPDAATDSGSDDVHAISEWTAGHDFWVYQFFAGGVLGLALPIALLWALWRGSMAYRAWRHRLPDAPWLPALGRALLVLAALPAASIGGNPLGNRFSGLVFGVALGVVVASYARIAHAMRMRAAETAARRAQPVVHDDDAPPGTPLPDDVLPAETTPRAQRDQDPPDSGSLTPYA